MIVYSITTCILHDSLDDKTPMEFMPRIFIPGISSSDFEVKSELTRPTKSNKIHECDDQTEQCH